MKLIVGLSPDINKSELDQDDVNFHDTVKKAMMDEISWWIGRMTSHELNILKHDLSIEFHIDINVTLDDDDSSSDDDLDISRKNWQNWLKQKQE